MKPAVEFGGLLLLVDEVDDAPGLARSRLMVSGRKLSGLVALRFAPTLARRAADGSSELTVADEDEGAVVRRLLFFIS